MFSIMSRANAIGDVYVNSGQVVGGDDVMTGQGDGLIPVMTGDVYSTDSGATTIGGDDTMTMDLDNSGFNTAAIGDVVVANGSSIVIGGEDQVFGSDNVDRVVGDVWQANPESYVEGGDDVLYGYGGNDVISGDFRILSSGANGAGRQ